jgi:hypothetical protein
VFQNRVLPATKKIQLLIEKKGTQLLLIVFSILNSCINSKNFNFMKTK